MSENIQEGFDVFVHDGDKAVGAVRKEFFKGEPPANTLLVVTALADPDLLVEIEAIVPLP